MIRVMEENLQGDNKQARDVLTADGSIPGSWLGHLHTRTRNSIQFMCFETHLIDDVHPVVPDHLPHKRNLFSVQHFHNLLKVLTLQV